MRRNYWSHPLMGQFDDGGGGGYYDYGGWGGYDYGGGGEIPYAPYTPGDLNPPTFEPLPQAPLPDLPFAQGPSFQDIFASSDIFGEPQAFIAPYPRDPFGQYSVIPNPPDVSLPNYPLTSPYNPWDFPPYTPTFPEGPAPPPPTQPYTPSPASAQHLPPYCPQGRYHPYPIGHPQQDVCIPFPSAPARQQQPSRPPATSSSGGGQQRFPAQQQQQKCPTGYRIDPWTLRCMPITPQQQQRCATPGTAFDPVRGLCVAPSQVSQLPPSGPGTEKSILDDLKNVPWWVWAGLAALLLLGSGEEKKKVTVQHRKSS